MPTTFPVTASTGIGGQQPVSLSEDYSGVVLNQDATATGTWDWRTTNLGGLLWQTFTLPSNYVRGTSANELRIPDLSGFQVLVNVDHGFASTATISYVLQYLSAGSVWVSLSAGTVIGCHADGLVWFDLLFPKSVVITEGILKSEFRLGLTTRPISNQPINQPISFSDGDQYGIGSETFTAHLTEGIPSPITLQGQPAFLLLTNGTVTYSFQQGVNTLRYVQPTPLVSAVTGQGRAYQGDGTTPLLGGGTTSAISFRALGLVADEGTDFLGNEYRSCVVQATGANVSTTHGANTRGNPGQGFWMSPPMPSPFAVQSLYFDVRNGLRDFVVIDGVLVDPITPNLTFSVYYSQDDAGTSEDMSEADWEGKLWSRVPKAFVATQRQQYVFPAPVHAKYVKLEFVNPQPRSYNPGDFPKPVTYKKHPTWVANFFLAELDLQRPVAQQVNVQYDALSFAYDYFLDDLQQLPASPVAVPSTVGPQLTNYFSPSAGSGVDPTTLAQINLAMQQFRAPLGTNVDTSTTIGQIVRNLTNAPTTVEGGTLPTLGFSSVSSLLREPVLIEQNFPVMYFFLGCRHGYKELTGHFDFNRAYFAGINDVAFLRADYTVASDTPLYVETSGDPINVESSDFTLNTDGNWYVY